MASGLRCQITELDGWVELVWVVISKSDESTSSMNIEREIWMIALIEWCCTAVSYPVQNFYMLVGGSVIVPKKQ